MANKLKSKETPFFVTIVFPTIIAILILIGFIVQSSLSITTAIKTNDIKKQLAENKNNLANNMEKLSDDFITDKMQYNFTDAELVNITSKYWNYELYINDSLVTKEDITVKKGNCEIKIVQKTQPSEFPSKILNMGATTGGDENDSVDLHVIFKSITANKPQVENSDNVLTTKWTFENIKANQNFSVELSPIIAQKLNYSFDKINITVK